MDFAHYNDSVDISTLRKYFVLIMWNLLFILNLELKVILGFIEEVRKEIESAIENLIEKYGS